VTTVELQQSKDVKCGTAVYMYSYSLWSLELTLELVCSGECRPALCFWPLTHAVQVNCILLSKGQYVESYSWKEKTLWGWTLKSSGLLRLVYTWKIYWRFEQSFRHFTVKYSKKSSSYLPAQPFLLDCLTRNMKALHCFETSVTVYQSTRWNVPEDLNLQQYCCENVRSPN
jgi:hypothetical protein